MVCVGKDLQDHFVCSIPLAMGKDTATKIMKMLGQMILLGVILRI